MYGQDWNPVVLVKSIHNPPRVHQKEGERKELIKRPSKELSSAMMEARLAKNIKQSDLAKMCHVTPSVINDMEMCRGTYDADITNRVCKTLGIHVKTRYIVVDITSNE